MTEARLVRLVGGPLDGREIRTDVDAVEAVVAMGGPDSAPLPD
ncbi:MAG: hypothetical protein ACYCXA_02035 [Actinomycetes bacterium]